jgi:hypothetical protein
MNRRRFLATSALAGLAPLAASAFSIVQPDAETRRLYLSGCRQGEADRHRRLVDELRQQLTGEAKEKGEVEKEVAAARCPVCGCPLSG